MRTIRTKVYKFDELTPDAQNKAVELLHDINTDFYWWDSTYSDFHSIAKYFGVDVDLKKTWFTLSYSQGDGSSFTADVDVCKLISCIKSEGWKEYAPKEVFNFPSITPNIERVAKLIDKKYIDISADVRPQGRATYVNAFFEWNYNATDVVIKEHTNIENAMDDLQEFVNSVCRELNRFLFRQLRNECDYLSSREAIIETIKANDYDFFKDGKLYDNR